MDAKIQKELSKVVTVQKNGKQVKMTKAEVGVTRLVDRYMAGDPKTMTIILGLLKMQVFHELNVQTCKQALCPPARLSSGVSAELASRSQ